MRRKVLGFDIRYFDPYRENNRLAVKKAKGGLPISLWETYSSMANCYGGVLLIGVIEKEGGSFDTTGLKDVEKILAVFWTSITRIFSRVIRYQAMKGFNHG